MGSYFVDLTGQVFGRLTVLRKVDKPENSKAKTARVYWLCRCECGNDVVRVGNNLRTGMTKSCGCLRVENVRTRRYKGYGGITGTYWGQVKTNARVRGLPLEVSIEDAWRLFLTQDGKCALSGLPIAMGTCAGVKLRIIGQTASLDRIDSSQGYIPGNVQWVHKRINQIKMDMPEGDFIELCRKVVDHHDAA